MTARDGSTPVDGGDSVPARPAGRPAATPQPLTLVAASVLANPARRRIAETLGGAPGGLTVAEIVDAVGDMHHNPVRNHLRVLARAGLVAVERDLPSGRGRPTERFSLIDPMASRIAAQQELLRLLVGLVRESGVDTAAAIAFGRSHGAEVISGIDRSALVASLARLGFAPHETTSTKDAAEGILEVRLDHCPFADAVVAPGGLVVCALHQGLIEAAAAAASSDARLTGFEIKHPHTAGCVVHLEGVPASSMSPAPPRRPRRSFKQSTAA
jgi:predicted ArsR family transcriptional regulator